MVSGLTPFIFWIIMIPIFIMAVYFMLKMYKYFKFLAQMVIEGIMDAKRFEAEMDKERAEFKKRFAEMSKKWIRMKEADCMPVTGMRDTSLHFPFDACPAFKTHL